MIAKEHSHNREGALPPSLLATTVPETVWLSGGLRDKGAVAVET